MHDERIGGASPHALLALNAILESQDPALVVDEVENGYVLGLEDYRNDLDLRTILHDLELDRSRYVHAADKRLRARLVSTEIRLWSGGPEDAFWTHGWPDNAGDDLREDLEREGLLGSDEGG